MYYHIGLFTITYVLDNFDYYLSNICLDYLIYAYIVDLYYIIVNNIFDLKLDSWYVIYASNLYVWTEIMTHGEASRLGRRGGRERDAFRQ